MNSRLNIPFFKPLFLFLKNHYKVFGAKQSATEYHFFNTDRPTHAIDRPLHAHWTKKRKRASKRAFRANQSPQNKENFLKTIKIKAASPFESHNMSIFGP